ncbi:hypothetical protein AVEN_175986-1 [Araneus ventricosus]|uniref:Uncharacterized protein n=1 Tax=Araneus ventricosus TaxID=182803 RepID=A0A4Y2ELC5_ARAVE|nr:hypothetical protein AVEN_175986-1 [Araneus ventricosus]
MYCFLTSCHSSLQSFNCKCDTKLYGIKVKTDEYWYDEGKHHTYKPPPPGWKYDMEQGSKSANVPLLNEIFVPLSKPQPGRSRSSNPNQRQGFPPQRGQSQFQEGRIPTDLQQFNPNRGQIQIFEGGQPVNPFQSQQDHSHGGQIHGSVNNGQFGGSFQSQEHFPNSGQNNDPNFNNGPGSLTGARGSQGSGRNSQEDTTDDIEEALEEMTEEPSSSISLFGKEYILCSIVLILNYAYQYILNI